MTIQATEVFETLKVVEGEIVIARRMIQELLNENSQLRASNVILERALEEATEEIQSLRDDSRCIMVDETLVPIKDLNAWLEKLKRDAQAEKA